MTKNRHLARTAGSAIAAALALSATPLLAQDVSAPAATSPAPLPVLQSPVVPQPAPSTAPSTAPSASTTAPNGTQPPASGTVNRVIVANPVVQQAPAEPTPEPVATDETATAATTAPTARTASAPPQRSAARTAAVPAAPVAAARPAAAPQADAPAAIPAAPAIAPAIPTEFDDNAAASAEDGADTAAWLGLLLSALAAAGLGVVALSVLRRRKTVDQVPILERPKVAAHTAPAQTLTTSPAVAAAPAFAPVLADPDPAPREVPIVNDPQPQADPETDLFRASVSTMDRQQAAVASAGAAVSLPRRPPATPEERRALLDRMVAAQPDRANPFRTRKARLHRAKLILQSLGRTFPGGKSRIDLSQYPLNWPELSRSHPAAA